MQVLVQIQTTLRDPERPDDDGTRTLYIKGKELTNAIRAAVRASGANGIHTGGVLTVQYVADGPAEVGFNPPKLYAASYQPPAVSFTGVTPPAAAPAAQQQYAPTTPPVSRPPQYRPRRPGSTRPCGRSSTRPSSRPSAASAAQAQPAY
jgi:hypothetical protein